MKIFSLGCRILVNTTGIFYSVILFILLVLKLAGRDQRWWVAFLINFMPFYFLPLVGFVLVGLIIRARVALLTTAPLLALGVCIYGPLFFQKHNPPTSDGFRVITFNVSEDNLNQAQVITWLSEKRAEIVLLQEVNVGWFSILRQELAQIYSYHIAVLTEQGARGNLIFSQYPIISVPSTIEQNHAVHRITVDLKGRLIALYNISLWAPVADTLHSDLSDTHRLVEFALSYDDYYRNDQINQLIGQTSTESYPYLVAGDFNMSDQSSIYSMLISQMGDSFREAGVGLGTSWPIFRANILGRIIPPLIRLDYIWHSSHFQAIEAEIGPFLGSDHLPVLATLSLVKNNEAH